MLGQGHKISDKLIGRRISEVSINWRETQVRLKNINVSNTKFNLKPSIRQKLTYAYINCHSDSGIGVGFE